MKKAFLLASILALLTAGCVQNLAALRDEGADEPIERASVDASPPLVQNITLKAPVARMTVFAEAGALLFKSAFQADDPAEIVFVDENSTLRLVASDSEALEPGATLATFRWSLNGKAVEGERSTTAAVGEPGLYTLKLNVTDSNGQSDEQTVKLGVAPKPFEVTSELVTGPVAGAEGEGQSASLTFALSAADAGVPATIQGVSFIATSPATCDAILVVTGPEEAMIGSKDDNGLGEEETVNAGALPEGEYVVTVKPFACVAPDGVPVAIVVTYVPIVPGLEAHGDGHGHAH